MSKKNEFVAHLQKHMTALAQVAEVAAEIEGVYFDRGYNSGGANVITDADISSTGMTAADVASIITVVQQYKNFAQNAAVTQGDYMATMNKARIDIKA